MGSPKDITGDIYNKNGAFEKYIGQGEYITNFHEHQDIKAKFRYITKF